HEFAFMGEMRMKFFDGIKALKPASATKPRQIHSRHAARGKLRQQLVSFDTLIRNFADSYL
ncbi:MAG TPA: hypothetical protein PLV85_13340, partial [Polyangiaceae bacterium]|nr:hypothetical protein [Polyangiaceae bacterium]